MHPTDRPAETGILLFIPAFFGLIAAGSFWQGNPVPNWLAVVVVGFWAHLSVYIHKEAVTAPEREKI